MKHKLQMNLNNILNIESVSHQSLSFTIYNVLGQPIYNNTLKEKTMQIDINQWTAGIYMFVVKENNYTKVYKFVKE